MSSPGSNWVKPFRNLIPPPILASNMKCLTIALRKPHLGTIKKFGVLFLKLKLSKLIPELIQKKLAELLVKLSYLCLVFTL